MVRSPGVPAPGTEAVVEEVAGPTEDGSGWAVTLNLQDGGDSLAELPEADLEPTGLAEDERGGRVMLEGLGPTEELRDSIELRLFTEIADGIDAARVATTIEQELAELLGGATVTIEAERHWSEPYNYELGVTIHPLDDPADALRRLTEAGGDCWLSCRDDGWRCDLWWSNAGDEDVHLIVPEVRGAELSFLPWRSPRRRPEDERPLVAVNLQGQLEYPDEPAYPDPELPDTEISDAEPGDEEP